MRYKYIVGIVAFVIIASAVGIMLSMKSATAPEILDPNNTKQGTLNQNKNQPVVSAKKGIKRFTLVAKTGAGIAGDGSITLKDDLTSMAVRLTEAPGLTGTNQYEVYVVPAGEEPIMAGTLQTFTNPNAKFLWGGAGEVDWFTAEKIIVTRRSTGQAKPGAIVAEAMMPTTAEQIQ